MTIAARAVVESAPHLPQVGPTPNTQKSPLQYSTSSVPHTVLYSHLSPVDVARHLSPAFGSIAGHVLVGGGGGGVVQPPVDFMIHAPSDAQ